jgi:hypothetical protein
MYTASLLLIVVFTGKFDGDMKPPEVPGRSSTGPQNHCASKTTKVLSAERMEPLAPGQPFRRPPGRPYCGAEPVPAEARRWPEGSLGDRFFTGTYLEEARNAPSLATAEIPDAAVIAADPVHWNVATDALVRAVVFDGLGLDHPAVRELLEVLAPIAEAELAYRKAADAAMYQIGTDWDEDEPGFPEQDGPVFLLGACVLVDAVWAAVGDDPLSDVLGVLLPVLGAAVPGVDSQVAAGALVGAFSTQSRREQPGDGEVLGRIGSYSGDALENLAAAGAVPPSDVLRVGLMILSALAQLCRSESPSVLQQAA